MLISHGLACAQERFAPAAGQPGSTAIAREDCRFVAWAEEVVFFQPGRLDISTDEAGLASFGEMANALGESDANPELPIEIVSLGDGGVITLRFPGGIADEPGPDFAVFENGFGDRFLELAFVEVSSDGQNFARFPSVSLTPTEEQVASFGTIDPSLIHNLAGKYRLGFGTPFDLAELAGIQGLNLQQISLVRLVDVVGSIDPRWGTRDSRGNFINDPYPTRLSSGGFDLDAIGVLHSATVNYAAWSRQDFGCGEPLGQQDADPDADSLSNLMEYAIGSDPSQPDTDKIRWSDLEFSFPWANRPDIEATLEATSDLQHWREEARWNPGSKAWDSTADGTLALVPSRGLVHARAKSAEPTFFTRLLIRLR